MAGFFGLFGSKTKYIDDPTPDKEATQQGEAFYLSDDDAKSMGNMELMRKPIAKKRASENTVPPSTPSVSPKAETNGQRSVDSNMDVFRKMAKDLKK
jgi:hypothetical protein